MSRTRKTVLTALVLAFVAAGIAFLAPPPALAATAPTNVAKLCDAIPAAKNAAAAEADKATIGLTTATITLTARRASMTTAISTFGDSIITFLRTVDTKGNTTAAGDVLRGHQVQFVDAVVAWSSARTAVYDIDRDLTFAQLRSSLLTSAETAGCPTP